jgi:hypothetical protein
MRPDYGFQGEGPFALKIGIVRSNPVKLRAARCWGVAGGKGMNE